MRARGTSHRRRRPPGRSRAALLLAASAVVAAALASASGAAADTVRCAYLDSVTVSGTTATAHVHVVLDHCQLSFVSIKKFANPVDDSVYDDSAKGIFDASDTLLQLSVPLPCDVQSETDLVLGEPVLYPPLAQDLGATHHYVDCPAGSGGSSGSGSTAGGGGGGGGGVYPDLGVTLSSDRDTVRIGGTVTLTVTVAAKAGTGGSTGTHLILSLPFNVTPLSIAQPGRGPGCTLTNVADCDLDWLSPPMTASMRVAVRVDSGGSVPFNARVVQDQPDAAPADNETSLAIPVQTDTGRAPAAVRYFAFTAWLGAGKPEPGVLKVSMRLGLKATVMPKLVDRRGKVLANLRRVTLPAGTSSVRLSLPTRLATPPKGTLLRLDAAGSRLRAQQVLRLP